MSLNIQIFGTKKCKETSKATRFFKERKISFQFTDFNIKGLSKGELTKVAQKIPLDELINKDGKEYEKRNLQYMVHDIEEELLNHPLLFKTPVIRNANNVTIGYQPDVWKSWL